MSEYKYGPDYPENTYVTHNYEEHLFDTGEILLNYAVTGSSDKPAILLIPAQAESWWGYEPVMERLENDFQLFAVDLRGQGRSSRTPGRYTFDNMGNDLVRFINGVIARPVVVCGLSSGGVISAWLSAYAPPGIIRGAYYEDPPLFSVELTPEIGPNIRQSVPGRMFPVASAYLGDQWKVGDWKGLIDACREFMAPQAITVLYGDGIEPTQRFKEYDPEWSRVCYEGTISASCNHSHMLAKVKCPILFTHHSCFIDEATGRLAGGTSEEQVKRIEQLITATGQPYTFKSFPDMGHQMHSIDPDLYVKTLTEWIKTLPG